LIQPLRSQNIFFSYIDYDGIRPLNYRAEDLFKKGVQLENFKTLVFAGIAKITPLVDYLRQESKEVFVTKFKDHQNFEPIDMVRIVKKFNEIISTKKIVITTEKDAMRLHDPRLFPLLEDVPVFFSSNKN
jgi:tetraacyldisaccharide 4'-kinase